MISKNKEIFELIFNEDYHIIHLGVKYKIISEPKKDKNGDYAYLIEEL